MGAKGRPPRRGSSLAGVLESWLFPTQLRRRSRDLVRRADQAALELLLEGEARLRRPPEPLVDEPLGRPYRVRGAARDLAGKRPGGGERVVVEPGQQADVRRVGPRDDAPRVDELAGEVAADEPGE